MAGPTVAMGRSAGLSANQSFTLYWGGQSVSSFGNFISLVAIPLFVITRLRASTFDVTALEALGWAPSMFIGLYVGVLVDRSGASAGS